LASKANGRGYLYFPDHPEYNQLLHAEVHPRHRAELRERLGNLPYKTIVLHEVKWSLWRRDLAEPLDQYD
jgi:hypothetical protein